MVEHRLAVGCGGVQQAVLVTGGHGHAHRVGETGAQGAGGGLDALGVTELRVTRCERPGGTQRCDVGDLQTVARHGQLNVLQQRGVALREHEAVATQPPVVGRVADHLVLVEQVGRRSQGDGGAGVARTGLLHGVGGQGLGDVDRLEVEVGELEGLSTHCGTPYVIADGAASARRAVRCGAGRHPHAVPGSVARNVVNGCSPRRVGSGGHPATDSPPTEQKYRHVRVRPGMVRVYRVDEHHGESLFMGYRSSA